MVRVPSRYEPCDSVVYGAAPGLGHPPSPGSAYGRCPSLPPEARTRTVSPDQPKPPRALRVPVVHASRHGQTRRIAERIAEHLRSLGLDSRAIELPSGASSAVQEADGTIVCSPLEESRHLPEAQRFVERNVEHLAALPSMFASVRLGVRSAREQDRENLRDLAGHVAVESGWNPHRVESAADRLSYTRYGWLTRWVMRRIARADGGSTDTSRDHGDTDREQVERLARGFAEDLGA